MIKNIPYRSPKSADAQMIAEALKNGNISGSDANLLIKKEGILWQKIAPHVVEDWWWLDQVRVKGTPALLDWKITGWDSTIYIEVAGYQLLIDPGPSVPIPETRPDLILITHAHRDHIGGLKAVLHKYPDCLVAMSRITDKFMKTRGYNFVKYSKLMGLNQQIMLQGINITTHRAGHLLGAVMFEIEIQGEIVLVTGDFAGRKVGGCPGFDYPNIDCSILILASGEAGQGSFPFADLRSNHMKFLEELDEFGEDRIYIPLQSLGQVQEAYAAIALSQRAGGWSEFEVYFDKSLESIISVYQDELAKQDSIWLENTPLEEMIWCGVPPQNGIVIGSEKSAPDTARNILKTNNIFTHASWGECMTLASWVSCPKIYTYHGSSNSLNIILDQMGFAMSFPNKE